MVRNLSALLVCLHLLVTPALATAPAAPPGDKPSQQSTHAEKPEAAEPQPASKTGGKAGKSQDEKKKEQEKVAKRTFFAAPMENETGQKQYQPVAAGLTDLVSVLLAQESSVTVVERQKLEELTKEQALSLKELTAQEYAVRAGKLLEADTVLTGRLFLLDRKLTVSMKALEISTARVVAADQISCRPEYLAEAALQLARRLAGQMAMPLPEIDLKAIDTSPIAGLHFAQGLSHYYAGDMDAAIMQLMRTIDLDPDYSEVHYWIGMCHYRLGEWPHAVIEWEKLIKRRPKSALAESVKGLLEEAKAHEKASPVQRLGPKPGAKWKAPEKVGDNPDAPKGKWLPPLRGGSTTSMHYENGEDYELKTEVTRVRGKVTQKGYFRKTLVDKKPRRTRSTIVKYKPDGTKEYSTSLVSHHTKAEWAKKDFLRLNSEDMARWFAAERAKYGITEKLSGEACDLDDADKIPDSSLDKYAHIAFREFDDKGRLTYVTRTEPIHWVGMMLRNARSLYHDNENFPSHLDRRKPEEDLIRVNTWRFWRRTQLVDDEGRAEKDKQRCVDFVGLYDATLQRIMIEMDYDAKPRPKIKSYEITHYKQNPKGRATKLLPEACKHYKVEIEDVTEGDPAMQGEWIKRVIVPSPAVEKEEKQ